MRTFFLIGTFLLSSTAAFSQAVTFQVSALRGKVQYQNRGLVKGEMINDSGIIQTSKGSFVKLTFGNNSGTLTLGPNSELDLKSVDLDKKESSLAVTLRKGAVRWVGQHKELGRLKGILTPQASLGVRGTDFVLKTSELFDESEIVVLDGLVNFENLANPNDRAQVKKGQWGGIGGRFGEVSGKIINLPKKILSHFDSSLKL